MFEAKKSVPVFIEHLLYFSRKNKKMLRWYPCLFFHILKLLPANCQTKLAAR
jgi:hypothetical protein